MSESENERARPKLPDIADMEAVIREQQADLHPQDDVIQGTTHQDQLRADAINAVLRAKGVENLMTAYEATKVFTILSHLEELAGYPDYGSRT